MKIIRYFIILLISQIILFPSNLFAQQFEGWKTDTSKKNIDLSELKSGGPPKDGIPAINDPGFVSSEEADSWIEANEPVISFELNDVARAYPLQILIWHEIVNDNFEGVPVLVTFCPLCYSAIVFDRRIDGETHEFGVSGFLRHSDMIMFDRKTESLWQQFTGEAVVGEYTGKELKILPSQIISYQQFKEAYPDGEILSKNTGVDRPYGRNPYSGYDDVNNTPFLAGDIEDDRLKPLQKVIGIQVDDHQKAYPYSMSKEEKVINDQIADQPIVVFHMEGARSALDAPELSNSRKDGSTGAFYRVVDGETLTFFNDGSSIKDRETNSTWDITGKAISGTMEGQKLEPVLFGDYFAFAWLVFWPETEIYN
ncbi:MAG: DUF3179 domain-containing protein [Balneolaceae bacterium]|nr:DUF3179 domain-containing protein [Balneolaceae bacterium]